MITGAALYVKAGGKVVGAIDLRASLAAAGYSFGDGGADEVSVTLGDQTDGIATNVSARLFVAGEAAGTAIGGAERTNEQAAESTFFGAVGS